MMIERTALPGVGIQHAAVPGPGFVLRNNDTVVAVSDRRGVAALSDVVTGHEAETP